MTKPSLFLTILYYTQLTSTTLTMIINTITILLYSAMAGSFASATPSPSRYHKLAQRAQAVASPDNTVLIESAEKYWCVCVLFPPLKPISE